MLDAGDIELKAGQQPGIEAGEDAILKVDVANELTGKCEFIMMNKARAVSWVFLACVTCMVAGCEKEFQSNAAKPGSSTVTGTVRLEIQFNAQRNNIDLEVPCDSDSTVYTVLVRAQTQGDLEFESTGRKAGEIMVTSIESVKNLASAGDNWVYRVNGKLGDKSSGLYPVSPGDQVLWVFGQYSENKD